MNHRVTAITATGSSSNFTMQKHTFPKSFREVGDGVTDNWITEQLSLTTDTLSGIIQQQQQQQQLLNKSDDTIEEDETYEDDGGVGGDGYGYGQTIVSSSSNSKDHPLHSSDGVVDASSSSVSKPPPPPPISNTNVTTTTATDAVERLKQFGEEVNRMSLAHDYHRIVRLLQSQQQPFTKETPLSHTAKLAQKIGILLLTHDAPPPPPTNDGSTNSSNHNTPINNNDSNKNMKQQQPPSYQAIYHALVSRYECLYTHARAKAILDIRRFLRKIAFPSSRGCNLLKTEFDAFLKKKTKEQLQRRKGSNEEGIELDYYGGGEDSKNNTGGEGGVGETKDINDSGNANANDNDGDGGLASCLWFLSQLQMMHDSVSNHTNTNHHQHPQPQPRRRRMDVLDELIRPIVERVHYHFLHTSTTTTDTPTTNDSSTNHPPPPPTATIPSSRSTPAGHEIEHTIRFTSSRLDRLPEWLLQYLRDLILEPPQQPQSQQQKQHGVQTILIDCIFPMLQILSYTQNRHINNRQAQHNHQNSTVDVTTTTTTTTTTPPPPTTTTTMMDTHACHYFWTEIFHLVRRVLLERNFFRHPSIVGGGVTTTANPNKVTSPLALCRAVEEILRFDSLLVADMMQRQQQQQQHQQINQSSSSLSTLVPHLMDVVLCPDDVIFTWWITLERNQAIATLRSAFATVVAYEGDDTSTNASPESGTSTTNANSSTAAKSATNKNNRDLTLLHPAAEATLTLLHAIETKSNLISDPNHRQIVIDGIEKPLCMEFMEMMNQDAAAARNNLLRVRKKKKNGKSGGSGSGILGDGELRVNVERWISVITATHAVGICVGQRSRRRRSLATTGTTTATRRFVSDDDDSGGGGEEEDVEWACTSLSRLRDAMLEEFGTAFVETILMEKAKLASYLMQCAFLLTTSSSSSSSSSSYAKDGSDNDENDDQEMAAMVKLSPGLAEVAHLLETVTSVCEGISDTLKSEQQQHQHQTIATANDHVNNDDHRDFSSHLMQYAPTQLQNTILHRIGNKFLEIVLDDGMIPSVSRYGANVFRNDVIILLCGFIDEDGLLRADRSRVRGTIDRLVDIVNLLAMDGVGFRSLKGAMGDLGRGDEDNGYDHLDGGDSNGSGSIDVKAFENDAMIYEQGRSMLQAKGFFHIELREAIGVMNRRVSDAAIY